MSASIWEGSESGGRCGCSSFMKTGPDAGLMWIAQMSFLVAGELSDGLVKYSVKSAAKTTVV